MVAAFKEVEMIRLKDLLCDDLKDTAKTLDRLQYATDVTQREQIVLEVIGRIEVMKQGLLELRKYIL